MGRFHKTQYTARHRHRQFLISMRPPTLAAICCNEYRAWHVLFPGMVIAQGVPVFRMNSQCSRPWAGLLRGWTCWRLRSEDSAPTPATQLLL